MGKDILVIGSEIKLFKEIERYYMDSAVDICYAENIQKAAYKIQMRECCLIILDIAPSDDSADETIAAIREKSPVPILVLMGDAGNAGKVAALKSGADNVLEKPFSMEILLAQMEALLRRYTELNQATHDSGEIICYGNLLLDMGRREVFIDGQEILLPHKEYEILLYMLQNRWRTLTSEQIYEAVWKDAYLDDKAVIFYHIGQLRRLLGDGWIETVYGVGYRLCNKSENKKN